MAARQFQAFLGNQEKGDTNMGIDCLACHVEAFRRGGAEVFGHTHRKPLAPSSSVLPDNTTSLALPEEGPLTEGLGRGLPSERLRAIPPTRD